VNGEVWSSNTSKGMLFSFEEILAHASQDETIFAGEFFGSGTVGGGCGLEHGRFLSDGDTIELDVEKIGVLRNKVVRQN
jgi:2-keto-4-pentenoate hydratase/2-oxohepta-3-ene-1,7-dioic acid hydratase in catechol pathway